MEYLSEDNSNVVKPVFISIERKVIVKEDRNGGPWHLRSSTAKFIVLLPQEKVPMMLLKKHTSKYAFLLVHLTNIL